VPEKYVREVVLAVPRAHAKLTCINSVAVVEELVASTPAAIHTLRDACSEVR
jgi:hypothetical protein